MRYTTALFNRVSPNYPNIDEDFVMNYWKNTSEIIIDHNLTREELIDLENYLKNGNVSKIGFGENVELTTMKEVNGLLKKVGKESGILLNPTQILNRTFTGKELKEIISLSVVDEDKFFVKEVFLGSSVSLREFKSYEGIKNYVLEVLKEFELTPLESAEFIYGHLRDMFSVEVADDNLYQASVRKKGSENSINSLLYTILRSAGFNANLNNSNGTYLISLNITDEKYGVNGEYPLDIITDINIKDVVGSDGLYTKFLEGLDKEALAFSLETLNRKVKSLKLNVQAASEESEVILEADREPAEESKKEVDVIMDNTMTFAIPVEEIRKASANYAVKTEMTPGIIMCSEFLEKENIKDEASFGEFLIRYGANSTLTNLIVSSSNYFGFINSKSESKVQFKNNELYIPTTENDNHSMKVIINDNGTFSVVNSEYSNFMDSGLRYGSTSILDFALYESGGALLTESVNRVTEVSEITKEMILPVYNISARKQSMVYNGSESKVLQSEEVSLIATREEGKLVASNIDEKFKMDKARTLGFDEKYYTKRKIAGLNKYSDGREVYLAEEELGDFDESGLIASNEAVLVKTSGKVNVLLVSMIVGFVIGIGIAISLLIMNIK